MISHNSFTYRTAIKEEIVKHIDIIFFQDLSQLERTNASVLPSHGISADAPSSAAHGVNFNY